MSVKSRVKQLVKAAGASATPAVKPEDCPCVTVYLPPNGRGDDPQPLYCPRCGKQVLVFMDDGEGT
jgi:hypothetical protein